MEVTYTSSTVLLSQQVENVDNEDTVGEELIEDDFLPSSQPKIKRGSRGGIRKKPLTQADKPKDKKYKDLIAVAAPNGNLQNIYNALLKIEVIRIITDILKDYLNLPKNVAYHAHQELWINYIFNGVNCAGAELKSQDEAKNIEDNTNHAEDYCIVNEQAYLTKIMHEVCRKVALYALKKGEKLLGAKKNTLSVFNSDVDDLQRKAKQTKGKNFQNGWYYLIPPEETKLRQDNNFLSIRNKVLYTKVVNDKYPDFKRLILSILASIERELPYAIDGSNPMNYFMKGIEGKKSLLDQIVEEISKELCSSTNPMTKDKQWAYVINALNNKETIEAKYNCDLRKPKFREPPQQVPKTESDSAQPEAASARVKDWKKIEKQIYSIIHKLFYVQLKEYLERQASTRTVEVFLKKIIKMKREERKYQTFADDFYDVMRYLLCKTDETFKQHFIHYEVTEYICAHGSSIRRSDLKSSSTIRLPFDFRIMTSVTLPNPDKNCFCGQPVKIKRKLYQLPNEMQYLIIDGRKYPPNESSLSYNWSLCCMITSSSATLIPQGQVNFPENMPIESSMFLIYKKK